MAVVSAKLAGVVTSARKGVVMMVVEFANRGSPHPGEVRGEVQADSGGNTGHEVVRDKDLGEDADMVNGVCAAQGVP